MNIFMKKTALYSLTLAGAVSAACSGSYTPEQLTFDSIKVEKRVALTKDANSPAYEMNINVKYVKEGSEDIRKSVNDAITAKIFNLHYVDITAAVDSFVNVNASSYKNDMLPL